MLFCLILEYGSNSFPQLAKLVVDLQNIYVITIRLLFTRTLVEGRLDPTTERRHEKKMLFSWSDHKVASTIALEFIRISRNIRIIERRK